MCAKAQVCVCAKVYVWRLGDSFHRLVLSFHHVGYRDQTQVIKSFYSLNHLTSPKCVLI